MLFGPDHYNGFFYDMMPPFCVGAAAESIGDYDTPAGDLSVDHEAAVALTQAALDAGVVALSERMYVDHGFAQPLQLLFGGLDHVPVVPRSSSTVSLSRSARRAGHGCSVRRSEGQWHWPARPVSRFRWPVA